MYRFNTTGLLLARFTSTYLNSSHGGGELRRDGGGGVQPPPELWRKVVRLTCDSTAKGGICQVYLVGTVHDKQKYCRLVKDVVNFVKPQVVFLELCSQRTGILEPHKPDNEYVSEKVANEPIVISEFQVAFEEAQKYGATVILGDQPIETTFNKLIHSKLAEKSRWQLIKILHYYYADVIKDEEEKYEIYNIRNGQWERCFPILYEIIVDERDQYMSAMLLKVASENESVVAVVGLGHLPGIQKYWKQNIKVEEQPLVFWPPRS